PACSTRSTTAVVASAFPEPRALKEDAPGSEGGGVTGSAGEAGCAGLSLGDAGHKGRCRPSTFVVPCIRESRCAENRTPLAAPACKRPRCPCSGSAGV